MGNKIEKKKRKNECIEECNNEIDDELLNKEIELDNIQNELNLLSCEEINERLEYHKDFIVKNLIVTNLLLLKLLELQVISDNQFKAYNLILTELKLEKDKLEYNDWDSLSLLNDREVKAFLNMIIESSCITVGKDFLQLLLKGYNTLHIVKYIVNHAIKYETSL